MRMDHDSNMKTAAMLYPAARDNKTFYGPVDDSGDNGADMSNCRDGVFILNVADIVDTQTIKATLQTRAGTTGDWADVFAEVTYTGTAGTDAAVYAIGVRDLKKYCRTKLVASNGAASTCSATLTGWDRVLVPVT